MIMDRRQAMEYANDYIKKVNPKLWDGNGDMPNTVSIEDCVIYDMNAMVQLIMFIYIREEDDRWCNSISLYNKWDDITIKSIDGEINSAEHIADSILKIWEMCE